MAMQFPVERIDIVELEPSISGPTRDRVPSGTEDAESYRLAASELVLAE